MHVEKIQNNENDKGLMLILDTQDETLFQCFLRMFYQFKMLELPPAVN
jgi:hypothetical protein